MSKVNTKMIPGCDVILKSSDDTLTGKTDENGFFTFDTVKPGSYTLTITKEGYEEYVYPETIDVSQGNFEVVCNCALEPISEIDEPNITINFVTNPIVKNAAITLKGDAEYSAVTNDKGKATISQVLYDTYALTCSAEGYKNYSTSILVNKSNNNPRSIEIGLDVDE